jgi:glycosyltransferase involved in cell wall biosynthesis
MRTPAAKRHFKAGPYCGPVRILLVSSLYPGPADPDFGVFVQGLERELEAQGNDVVRAVVDRRGGSVTKQVSLLLDALRGARPRPDVVYAHYLVPAGAAAAAASVAARVPLVVTAHGRDVRNIGTVRGVGAATRAVVRRASSVICVSDYLRRELVARIPEAGSKTEVISAGVDLDRFAPRDADEARAMVGWTEEGPRFLCVGSLDARKNVVRLADAFATVGPGSLVFVGDGPLRAELEGRPGVRLTGRIGHDRVPDWIAASDVVCQPSLVEPFGIALLEAMASARSVVATDVGGPPEFVTPEAGVLVDPTSVEPIADGLRAVAAFPTPNLAARQAAEPYDVRREARRVADVLERAVSGARAQ